MIFMTKMRRYLHHSASYTKLQLQPKMATNSKPTWEHQKQNLKPDYLTTNQL